MSYKNKNQKSIDKKLIALMIFVAVALFTYIIFIYLEKKDGFAYINKLGWTTYESKYQPIVFSHPKEWKIISVANHVTESQLYARVNDAKDQDNTMVEISYSKNYPVTNNKFSYPIAEGRPIEPICPYEIIPAAPAICKEVSANLATGYMHSGKGRDMKDVLRWHARIGNENIRVESYRLDEATFKSIVKSIRSSPSRVGRESLVASNELSHADIKSHERNSKITSNALDSLNVSDCEKIKGITYAESSQDKNKIRIYEEWQSRISCKEKVEVAIKKNQSDPPQSNRPF